MINFKKLLIVNSTRSADIHTSFRLGKYIDHYVKESDSHSEPSFLPLVNPKVQVLECLFSIQGDCNNAIVENGPE